MEHILLGVGPWIQFSSVYTADQTMDQENVNTNFSPSSMRQSDYWLLPGNITTYPLDLV